MLSKTVSNHLDSYVLWRANDITLPAIALDQFSLRAGATQIGLLGALPDSLECLQGLDIVPGSNHPCFETISLNIYLLMRQPVCVASRLSQRSILVPWGLSKEVAGGSGVSLAFLGTEDMAQYNHRKQWKQQRVDDVDAFPAAFTLLLSSILSLLVEFCNHWCIREHQFPSVTTAPSSLFPSALSS